MQLYIIRHAQSTNNVLLDQRDRVCDPPLTELGLRQADLLAQHLADGGQLEPPGSGADDCGPGGYCITRLYCSAMWRALQTAAPIGRALGLQPEVWADIHEQGGIYLDHNGRGRVGYPGKTRQEIQAVFPGYVLPDNVTSYGWWDRPYEEWPACYERAARVAEQLRQWAAGDERVALITHGGFIDALLKTLLDQSPGRRFFYYHYNVAISRIDFRRDGRLGIHYMNRVGHLPPELIS